MKKTYEIGLIGCDDETYASVELSNKELELVKKISDLLNKSATSHCMPTMTIEENK